ncbi:hypothetical protein C7477_10614 [Phyllobacterium leguminum]|uniref:Uncharacterized protein n=1 Tax=Phyllobacterium leguminum TaxID=314237 RepID=A0A318T7T6_9HYPH|nr:hypothetical protein C7477_10614 [Phyllobacterium leguminum]
MGVVMAALNLHHPHPALRATLPARGRENRPPKESNPRQPIRADIRNA